MINPCGYLSYLVFLSCALSAMGRRTVNPYPVSYSGLGEYRPQKCYRYYPVYCVADSPEDIGTTFYLYSNDSTWPPYLQYEDNMTIPFFNITKDTKVIIHGYGQSANTTEIANIRDALLNNIDCNVIMVDYQNGSQLMNGLIESIMNGLLVSKQLSIFIQLLHLNNGLDLDQVHFIGFSLGAQIAALAAKDIDKTFNSKIGRLTALDAATEWFDCRPKSERITKDDAKFVDAIHTSIKPVAGQKFGTPYAVGEVDVYVNKGITQPGCVAKPKGRDRFLLSILSCSSLFSASLYAESITSQCPFMTRPCSNTTCTSRNRHLCNGRMGYYSNVATGRGKQCITITSTPPYRYCNE